MSQLLSTSYLSHVLSPSQFCRTLEVAVKTLTPVLDKFDAIAVTGNSGTLFGGALSLAINKPIILVRKTTEGSHSASLVEGCNLEHNPRYLFVDDLISTGNTKCRVRDSIQGIAIYVGHYTTYTDWLLLDGDL